MVGTAFDRWALSSWADIHDFEETRWWRIKVTHLVAVFLRFYCDVNYTHLRIKVVINVRGRTRCSKKYQKIYTNSIRRYCHCLATFRKVYILEYMLIVTFGSSINKGEKCQYENDTHMIIYYRHLWTNEKIVMIESNLCFFPSDSIRNSI